MSYNNITKDCFFAPRHVGTLDIHQPLTIIYSNKTKTSVITLYMSYNKEQVIESLRFKTNGNPYIIAGLEWACRQLEGQALMSLSALGHQKIMDALDMPFQQLPTAVQISQAFQELRSLTTQQCEEES